MTTANTQAREQLIAEIRTAFDKVSRTNAVSWSEAVVIDGYGSDEDRAAARVLDRDTHWSQLIDNPNWHAFPGTGGFVFLDTGGVRYYLPPALIRHLRGTIEEWYPGHLPGEIERCAFGGSDGNQPVLSKPRMTCLAKFVHLLAHSTEEADRASVWRTALDNRWYKYLE